VPVECTADQAHQSFHPAYAGLERIPLPAPVKKHTGAIQPFSSRNASLAG